MYAFSVSEFQTRANKYIKDIDDRGKKVFSYWWNWIIFKFS